MCHNHHILASNNITIAFVKDNPIRKIKSHEAYVFKANGYFSISNRGIISRKYEDKATPDWCERLQVNINELELNSYTKQAGFCRNSVDASS